MLLRKSMLLYLLLIPLFAGAQSLKEEPLELVKNIYLTGQTYVDSVRLRWAPSDYLIWENMRTTGLIIQRQTLMRDGDLVPLTERRTITQVSDTILFPAPATAFRDRAENEYVAIGGQALYGERFEVDGDDGMTLGAMINQARENENRFGFGLFAADHSWEAAKMMALAITDTDTERNHVYVYRVLPAGPIEGYDTLQSGFVTIDVNDNAPKPKVSGLSAEFGDRVAMLSWNVSLAQDFYTSYDIERSEDGVDWDKVNRLPFVPLIKNGDRPLALYRDSLPANGRPYFYRVVGNTPFQLRGLPTDAVQGMGLNPLPQSAPALSSILLNENDQFQIAWEFPAEERITGFRVERSRTDDGVFSPISEVLSASTRGYLDEAPMATNYYRVVAIDEYDREIPSYAGLAQMDDVTPPSVPDGLRGVIMPDGKMILTWDANREDDLLGYRVWIANREGDEYSLASNAPVIDNFFVGKTTLKTLTPRLFVKLSALDLRHNASPLSAAVAIARPDTIPPAAPVLNGIVAGNDSLVLSWEFSRSPDVDFHELSRREAGETEWQTIANYPASAGGSVTGYVDTEPMPGKMMEYQLSAIDLAGLRTDSKPLRGQLIDDYIRRSVDRVTAAADRRNKLIRLRWEYVPENRQFSHFDIYRGPHEGKQVLIASVGSEEARPLSERKKVENTFSYVDASRLKMDTPYEYQIRAVYHDGGLSRLSAPATVNY